MPKLHFVFLEGEGGHYRTVIGRVGSKNKIGILLVFSEDLYIFHLQAFALEVDKVDAVMMSPGITNFVSRGPG